MGRVRRRTLLVPLLAGLLAPALPALPALPATATDADAGYVVYALDLPHSGSDTFDATAGDTVTAHVAADRSLVVSGAHAGATAQTLTVRPDAATTLGAGTYTVGNGVAVTLTGCWSAVTAGTVVISERTDDAAGALATLALSYDVTCDSTGRVTGTVRYHSAAAWAGVRTAVTGPYAVVKDQTGTRTVTITGTGPTPVTLGAATLAPYYSGTGGFTVAGNGCAGVTLAAGASCAVTLSFAPTAIERYAALLSLAADTPRGVVLRVVDARGVVAPPAPADVRAVAGDDGIGVSWTPVTSTWDRPWITEYRVYRDGGTEPVATVTTPSYVDPGAPGDTHSYRVSAAGQGVEGAASAAQQATVPAAPTDGTGAVTGAAWATPAYDAATAAPAAAAVGRLDVKAGPYTLAIRPVSGTAWVPGTVHADVSVTGVCAAPAAPLTVTEARVHADGTPVTLALSGQVSCGGTTVDLDVRHAATTPLHAADITPDVAHFPATPPGRSSAPIAVTVANHGSAPLELGAPVVPAHWRVDSNTCAVVVPAGSCSLGLVFAPTVAAGHSGVLTLPDSSPRGYRQVTVRGDSRTVPGAVRNLRATALVGRVLLTFDKPEPDYPASSWYTAEWATASTGPWQRVGSGESTRLVHSYTAIGRRLYYRVRAQNGEGSGPYAHTSALTTGRELVYAADTGSGLYHLTARGVPGSTAARLTTSPADEEDPTFTADRRHLTFTREDFPGRWHIHTGTSSTSSLWKEVGDVGGVPWTYRNPRWSPDRSYLAYACRPVTRTYWDLCVRDSIDRVRTVPGVLANGGHWLPNGNELVVVSATSPPTIQIVAPDNSYRIAIPGTSDARDVALSPDGSRIAWTRYEGTEGDPSTGGGPRRSLRVSPLSGGAGVVLRSTGYSNDPEWSVDGESLYFTYGERTTGVPLRRDVWSARATGGGLVNLTKTPEVDEDNVAVRDLVTPVPSPQAARPLQDFTGDGRADIAVFRPGTGAWRIRGVATTAYWGRLGDIPVAADYLGDKKAERAVFRPSDGTWRIQGRAVVTYGRRGDVPVPADYNGDGKAEIAVFRPSDGTWRIYGRAPLAHGRRGDIPVPADYDGDKRADIGVYRPSTRTWMVRGQGPSFFPGVPAPGDYFGWGRAQYATLEGDEWRVSHNPFARVPRSFNDVPAYGNFNGDRRLEPGVFNSTLGLWRILGQSNVVWGRPGDIAV